MSPTPITIITGFLGSGKTTLILNLIPQLPATYRLALLKNEFGDVAIDSQIASSQSISGVQELLNGCICCNLVGQLGDALETLRKDVEPDRIVIETSGSAFPATLAMEVNRLGRETGHYVLDGVIVVIDVENWKGYEDTSYTAKLQARYTDLVVLNKWEVAGERRLDDCLDRLGDLDIDVATVKSDHGKVSKDALLGLDCSLARDLDMSETEKSHGHTPGSNSADHWDHTHNQEVEVLSLTLTTSIKPDDHPVLDMAKLEDFLTSAPKEEIYRIKSIFTTDDTPISSESMTNASKAENQTSDSSTSQNNSNQDQHQQNVQSRKRYILNWAFGRWTITSLSTSTSSAPASAGNAPKTSEAIMRTTIVLARDEGNKWKKRIEENQDRWIALKDYSEEHEGVLTIRRIT